MRFFRHGIIKSPGGLKRGEDDYGAFGQADLSVCHGICVSRGKGNEKSGVAPGDSGTDSDRNLSSRNAGNQSCVECVLYGQPFVLRAAKNFYAFVADAAVMLISLPLCTRLDAFFR